MNDRTIMFTADSNVAMKGVSQHQAHSAGSLVSLPDTKRQTGTKVSFLVTVILRHFFALFIIVFILLVLLKNADNVKLFPRKSSQITALHVASMPCNERTLRSSAIGTIEEAFKG